MEKNKIFFSNLEIIGHFLGNVNDMLEINCTPGGNRIPRPYGTLLESAYPTYGCRRVYFNVVKFDHFVYPRRDSNPRKTVL